MIMILEYLIEMLFCCWEFLMEDVVREVGVFG